MLKNYLKIAWRNIKKNKSTSFINVLGLGIGISASMIIVMIVRYNTSFDNWEPHHSNVYRLYTYSGADDINSGVTTALPEAIRNRLTGIDVVSHFLYLNGSSAALIDGKDGATKSFPKNEGVVFADSSFFSIFPYNWLVGNPKTSLGAPNTVVLSKSSAEKFFPNENLPNLIGKHILFGDSTHVTVSGIVDDLKNQSDFSYKVFISYPTITSSELLKKAYGWGVWGHVSYASLCAIRLQIGTDPSLIEKELKAIVLANSEPEAGMNGDEPKLLRLDQNHFTMDVDGSISKTTIFSLSFIALLILFLAIVNYVNLSTAQASLRSKEIGVRKVFGGNQKQIRLQFFIETFSLVLISALLAIALTPLLMKGFASYIPNKLALSDIFSREGIVSLIVLITLTTVAAGVYPALVLAKFKPIKVLKSNTSSKGFKSNTARKTLIISQFAIAQVLLVLVFIVSKQIHYSLSKDLGYKNVKGIISISIPDVEKRYDSKKYTLINKIKQSSGILQVSLSSAAPTSNSQHISVASSKLKQETTNFSVWVLTGDTNYVHLFGIPVVAGNNVTTDTASDLKSVLVNETFAKQMGYLRPEDAVNKPFGFDGDRAIVRGVLHDFNTGSTKSAMRPVIYYFDEGHARLLNMLLSGNPSDWQAQIKKVQEIYRQLYPNNLFDYSFLDQSIEKLYKADIAISKTLTWATGLAIFISCLGLFGLVTFTANQRKKEIGIRKVLGASISQIVLMLSQSMLKLVFIASAISLPVAWILGDRWLREFSYRTDISWWIFFVTLLFAAFIASAVVSFQAIKAALANPVESLRTE